MIDKEYSGEMTDREEACLEFVSQNLANDIVELGIRRYSEVSQKRGYCKEYNV